MVPDPFRILVVRGTWNPPQDGSMSSWPWGLDFVRAMFNGPYHYSIANYWRRASFDILNVHFDVEQTGAAGIPLTGLDANYLTPRRAEATSAIRDFARNEGINVDGYDGFIALTNPPHCNAGSNSDPSGLWDQYCFLEWCQHETGHVLGFGPHAFGPDGTGTWTDYADEYCIMGWTGPQDHTVDQPPEASGVVTPLHPQFWQSGRRLAAAHMYRVFPAEFAPWVGGMRQHQIEVIGSSSDLAEYGSPSYAKALGVFDYAPGQVITVEYRMNTEDDLGIDPAIVVHSIGLRPLAAPFDPSGRPICFEGKLAPQPGARLDIGGTNLAVRVVSAEYPGLGRPPVAQVVIE